MALLEVALLALVEAHLQSEAVEYLAIGPAEEIINRQRHNLGYYVAVQQYGTQVQHVVPKSSHERTTKIKPLRAHAPPR